MCCSLFRLFIFSILTFTANYIFAQPSTCDINLRLLNSDLISMLNKIPAMPPITQIYSPVKKLYDEAKTAKDSGKYSECVNKTDLALKYSKPYGNRQ
jgi:hypothetical protein